MSLDAMRQLARQHTKRTTQLLDIPAVVQYSEDLPDNKVRVWRTDIRQEAIVDGLIREPGTEVWLREMRNNEYQIITVNIAASTPRFGKALAAKTQPSGLDELVARSVPGNGLKPGRLEASQRGGLYVHVSELWHSGGYWAGGTVTDGVLDQTANDLDLTAFVPAGVTETGWVVVYLNPATNALGAVAGVPYIGVTPADLLVADIASITIPIGCYFCGALSLSNGQTEIVGVSRFADRREWLTPHGALTPLAATVSTTNATQTTLATIATTSNSIVTVKVYVVARRTGGSSGTAGDGAGYELFGTFKNVSGTLSQIGTTGKVAQESQSGWDVDFTISGTSIRISVTGAANNNVSWFARYQVVGV